VIAALRKKEIFCTQVDKEAELGAKNEPVQTLLWRDDLLAADRKPSDPPSSHKPTSAVGRKNIQDALFNEGLLAAKASAGVNTLLELQETLTKQLGQNSLETRVRYTSSILRWFFPDGLNGLAKHVWMAYGDEIIETDILRYLYLTAEPLMGACVAEALFPLENGMQIPPQYFDQFLNSFLSEPPSEKTRKRLKSNLMRLGFLYRAPGKLDRLKTVMPAKSSLLILLHHLFSQQGTRTVELRRLLADPFWKYLGYKSEDAVRSVLRLANSAGILGKYVVADQLEQITTIMSADEFLTRKVRL
jgi:hypothetical protein